MSELDRGRLAERAPRRAEQAPGGETHGTEPARPTGVMPSQPPTSPRMRNRDPLKRSISSRARWVTHGPVGWVVMPPRCTRRVACSTKISTYSRRRNTVSTQKKSQATMPLAWAARNCDQVGPDRRGAGLIPCRWRIIHTVEAATR